MSGERNECPDFFFLEALGNLYVTGIGFTHSTICCTNPNTDPNAVCFGMYPSKDGLGKILSPGFIKHDTKNKGKIRDCEERLVCPGNDPCKKIPQEGTSTGDTYFLPGSNCHSIATCPKPSNWGK